jgi:hypothetical protein
MFEEPRHRQPRQVGVLDQHLLTRRGDHLDRRDGRRQRAEHPVLDARDGRSERRRDPLPRGQHVADDRHPHAFDRFEQQRRPAVGRCQHR